MKLIKPIALVAVGILIGGAVTANAVTTTDPVTLCVRSGAVVRVDDTCTSRETKIEVASQADVAALAARMDADDADDAALAAQVASLAAQVASQDAVLDELKSLVTADVTFSFHGDVLTVEGRRLLPGSVLTVTVLAGGVYVTNLSVGDGGTISAEILHHCDYPVSFFGDYSAQGTDWSGQPYETTHVVIPCGSIPP
jgi:hypothetical protein